MTTEATTFSGRIEGRKAGYKTFTKPNFLRRFSHFVEHSDWDEVMLAQDEWIDKVCMGIIIVASLYFIPPVLVMLFF
ncbi:MAG: hypothetical protein ACYDAA_10315 [Syntrophales bacterium]